MVGDCQLYRRRNMMTQEYIQHLFIKVLEGEELSSSEQAELMTWLQKHPEDQALFSDLSDVWVNLDISSELSDELIAEKWDQLHTSISSRLAHEKTMQRVGKWMVMRKYVAVFAVGAIVAASIILGLPMLHKSQVAMQSIEVPLGAKSVIQLADGSEVILNAGSKLEYDSRLGQKTREVFLDGEACFKVTKNPNMPFVVHTSAITVKAYGTRFNVKSYPTDRPIEATLTEGIISVQKISSGIKGNPKEYFLEPNQQAIYHKALPGIKKEQLFISKNVDADLYLSWINDQIQVKSLTLGELAILLERKYNVTIHIENKELQKLKFSGTLENETIEQVLTAMQLASSVQFKIKNREIWLTK